MRIQDFAKGVLSDVVMTVLGVSGRGGGISTISLLPSSSIGIVTFPPTCGGISSYAVGLAGEGGP